MTGTRLDLATWPRADQFRFFRTFAKPHFATTARVDVSVMMRARAARGLSPFRTALWAFGAALHAVPELRLRFEGETVWSFDQLTLSPTIATPDGDFRFAYLDWTPDRTAFDRAAEAEIGRVRQGGIVHNPNVGRLDVAYLSCLPWLDYTSVDNAMPGPDDCIPRISWGRIVPKGDGFDMAVTLEVHHALVDGRHVGQWFEALGRALTDL